LIRFDAAMNSHDPSTPPPNDAPTAPKQRTLKRRTMLGVGLVLAVYLATAYIALPLFWRTYVHRHPSLEDIPEIAYTATGIPGDPLNVAVVAAEEQLKRAMTSAKWYPADPLSLRSDLEIAEATVLKRPFDDAPVSSLYFDGRKEDLAFEMPVGPDPRKRHHVRFWKTDKLDGDGRPTWVGSATFDERVGLSDTTGEVTHHIAPNVDAERDHVIDSLKATGDVAETYLGPGFHKIDQGRNGGGDPWHTDGNLAVALLRNP
jgi:hypothetical protein